MMKNYFFRTALLERLVKINEVSAGTNFVNLFCASQQNYFCNHL